MNDMSDLERQRLKKLEHLREAGIDPYPPRTRRTHTAVQALEAYETVEGIEAQELQLVGRLRSIREMGGSTFAHIADGSGQIQLYFRQDILGEEGYTHFLDSYDIGDFIATRGQLFRTGTGETTLEVQDFRILAKSLHPLPAKWHGLKDVETRYRQRYLDLIANQEVRALFRQRAGIVKAMRRFLDNRGFLEVETPVLQPIYGGAVARPFTTYYHALDHTFYLRISDELYLKRLIIGGYERVYEICKDFRNEGLSKEHNPEFTMMECYQAYADYYDMMSLTEEMFAFIAEDVLGTTTLTYQDNQINLTPPWSRLPLRQAIEESTGIDIEDDPEFEALQSRIEEAGLTVDPQPTWGKLVDELFSEFVEPNLIQPTFITDYPVQLSPLAKVKPGASHLVERFEPFVGGLELGNAFTELNDPLDQRERFQEQAKAGEAGDKEAHPVDEDFITAMRYGMPPTGGLGIGVDRLVMLLTDQSSIREVILFPQLRSKD